MKVAIIGSVGIPGNYGGFETLTENLAKILDKKLELTVYCSAKNYEKNKLYNCKLNCPINRGLNQIKN